MSVIRRPAVAGYYYPADPERLRSAVDRLAPFSSLRRDVRAMILPHGSFMQAGRVMGAAFAGATIPRRCIVVGPSHTGSWIRWGVMASGAYQTPLGEIPIDQEGAEALRRRCPFLEADRWVQRGEHAIEVLLPFLQRLGPEDLSLLPIIVGEEDAERCAQLGQALAQLIRMSEEPALLIASSDLSQYQSQPDGQAKDRRLIERLCALDAPGLLQAVQEEQITMCGAGAAACVLDAARALGAARGTAVAYATSAQAGGDPDSATGYAGILIA